MEGVERVRQRRAIAEAAQQGRLSPDQGRLLGLPSGTVQCPVCGMWAFDVEGAQRCCAVDGQWHEDIEAHGIVARVVDGRALCAGADRLVQERGLSGRRALGIYVSFWWSVERGRLERLQAQTWVQLLALFDGKVPGCVEIEGAMR